MTQLTSITVATLLDAFASDQPYPAGGSASALSGAVGVSLLMMVAALPKTRSGSPTEAAALGVAWAELREIRVELSRLIDADSEAYAAVVAALRSARTTDAERARRREAIGEAMRRATEVPLETLRAAGRGLRSARHVAPSAAAAAASDVTVAIELLLAAARGAASSIRANLDTLSDRDFAARTATELVDLERVTQEHAALARAAL